MKKLKTIMAVTSSVMLALFSVSGWALNTDLDSNTISAADYLKHAQADITEDNAGNGSPDIDPEDGGWDWRLTSPNFTHTATPSPLNIYGATAMGLYYAYLKTSAATYLTAMTDAANIMIANASIRSAQDISFLIYFQDLPGVTPDIYQNAAKVKFDGRITNYGSATALAQYIRDVRAGQGYQNGIIPWDIGAWAVAAQMLEQKFPSDPYDYAQAADDIAEVIYQDSYMVNPGYFDLTSDKNEVCNAAYGYWYTLGITGLIDAFVTANVHTDKLADLVTLLLECQYDGEGAFSYCYGATPDDEDWQSTSYAVRSLARVDPSTYATNINYACYWLGVTQDASGGWLYSNGNHYPEIGGENTAALYFGANLYNANPNVVWVDDDYDASSSGGHLWGYDAFDNIQAGFDAVANGGLVNVEDGAYIVDAPIVLNKPVTIFGLSTSAIVQGTNDTDFSIFEIRASDVTIQNLNITHDTMPEYPIQPPYPAWNELVYALVRIPASLGLSGVCITGNTIYVDAQPGAMKTWTGIGITVGRANGQAGSPVNITGNTIYNTRSGVINQYQSYVTVSDNDIYNTKGGIMNYTNNQADADNRTMSNNTWGETTLTPHNEWDIVWNTGGTLFDPDYQQTVLALSIANNDAYVVDRRSADGTAEDNRSHIFVDGSSIYNAPNPAQGNFNEPFSTLALGIDAVVDGGKIIVAPGTCTETVQSVIDKEVLIVAEDPNDKPIIQCGFNTGNSGNARGWFLVTADGEPDVNDLIFDGTGFNVYQAFRILGSGSFINCEFSNIKYPTYMGNAIAAMGVGPVNVRGCSFEQIGRLGVIYFGSGVAGSVYDNNVYTGKGDGDWLDYGVELGGGGAATIQNSTITNCTGVALSDGSTSAGVLATTYFGGGTVGTILNNDLTGNTSGIAVGYNESDTSVVVARYNDLSGNDWGVTSTGPMVDAEENWWGDASGPYDAAGSNEVPPCTSDPATEVNSNGTGVNVDENVDYCPWQPYLDPDIDDDGICNPNSTDPSCTGSDNCMLTPNPLQEDTDSSGIGDACNDEIDADSDEWEDSLDNCPTVFNDQTDTDDDDVGDVCDNCPDDANTDQINSDGDTLGDACDNCPLNTNPLQEDTVPPGGNGIGDVCECEPDFTCDGDVDGSDATTFKIYFGRGPAFSIGGPCTNLNPCRGDFDCDANVDGSDAALFKKDYGRSLLLNACPAEPPCSPAAWCSY